MIDSADFLENIKKQNLSFRGSKESGYPVVVLDIIFFFFLNTFLFSFDAGEKQEQNGPYSP